MALLNIWPNSKHPKVRAWLDRHPRWTFYFVPTSCSWLNAVEGFFAKLVKRRLKRGVRGRPRTVGGYGPSLHSLVDLQTAINQFLAHHNEHEAKPFRWTADPDKIINAVRRGHQALDSDH